MKLSSREKTPKKFIHNKVTYLLLDTILKKSNNPSSRPSSRRQLLLLMTLVVMFITFITSKAQDACANNTTGNFLLQLAATSGLLLIADVIAVIQIFNLFTPVTHIELFGEDEFKDNYQKYKSVRTSKYAHKIHLRGRKILTKTCETRLFPHS